LGKTIVLTNNISQLNLYNAFRAFSALGELTGVFVTLLKRIEDHMDKNDHFYQPGEQFFDYNPRV
jgi:hypothetical protein